MHTNSTPALFTLRNAMLRSSTAILAICGLMQTAKATNNHFLPGDAFFSIEISQADIVRWADSTEKELKLDYSRFDGEFFACGSLGYSTLAVEGFVPELRSALVEAYWRYADGVRPLYRDEGNDGHSVLEQTNSVVALIYNKSFDLKLPLGLKFNEDWSAQGLRHYSGLFETAKPVVIDWKEAATVSPLRIREKLDPLSHTAGGYEVGRTLDEALHIGGDDVQIVLVGFAEQKGYAMFKRCPNLQSIFDGEEYARYMVVTKEMIREFSCDDKGGWTEAATQIPLIGEDSKIPKRVWLPGVPKK